MPHDAPTPWHRLFGMALTDLFTGRPWRVELELELALKSQRLDVLIIERLTGQAATRDPAAVDDLPDGLDTLAAHNILTYKSAQESLDAWAIDELIGHYVTYRKLASGSASTATGAADPDRDPGASQAGRRLLPAADFRLFAVATRHPHRLLAQLHPSARCPTAWPGVYDLTWGHRPIRLIVLNAIAPQPHNAPWELFASEMTRLRSGLAHFQPHSPAARLLRYHLMQAHRLELTDMSYTVTDFKIDTLRLMLTDPWLTPEEHAALRAGLLEKLDPEERLHGLDPAEVLKRYAPEERLRGLPPNEILRGMDPEQIKAWLKRTGH